MKDIGIRELKTHASRIVREVCRDHERYVVTDRGRPVGLLTPLDDAGSFPNASGTAWDDMENLAARIRKSWNSNKTAVEIVSELRR